MLATVAATALLSCIGPRSTLLWFPDPTVAVAAAGAAGTVLAVREPTPLVRRR